MKISRMLTATLVVGGAMTSYATEVKDSNIDNGDGRQFSSTKNAKYVKYFDQLDNNFQETESNFIDGYADDQYAQESSYTSPHIATSSELSTKSTPALSALALLGFLYFLNLIQNVLQGTSGKKKREASDELFSTLENVEHYMKNIENFIDVISEYVPVDQSPMYNKGRSLPFSERSLEDRADRVMNFFYSMWNKVTSALGFNRWGDISRNDYDVESRPTQPDGGMWSMFGNKIGLIATIMDFLNDPNPTRIGRSIREDTFREELDEEIELAEPKEPSDEDKKFIPKEIISRQKRFTDGMNAWYSHPQEYEKQQRTGLASSPIYGMLFNLLKGAITGQN